MVIDTLMEIFEDVLAFGVGALIARKTA